MKKPSEQSSKKPVGKIREIPGLQVKSKLYVDPRFDTATGKADLQRVRKNYQFLDDYREDEIAQLQHDLKRVKDPQEKAEIAQAIKSQKSKLETFRRRDQEYEIMKDVKNKKISRAKKRELLLTEQFKRMSSKDRARKIEKRQKKIAQKQKKMLPDRRV